MIADTDTDIDTEVDDFVFDEMKRNFRSHSKVFFSDPSFKSGNWLLKLFVDFDLSVRR
jgi:hypothetical protein